MRIVLLVWMEVQPINKQYYLIQPISKQLKARIMQSGKIASQPSSAHWPDLLICNLPATAHSLRNLFLLLVVETVKFAVKLAKVYSCLKLSNSQALPVNPPQNSYAKTPNRILIKILTTIYNKAKV